jgi:hypothetical protein
MIIPFNPFPYSILKKAITHIKTGYAMHPGLQNTKTNSAEINICETITNKKSYLGPFI